MPGFTGSSLPRGRAALLPPGLEKGRGPRRGRGPHLDVHRRADIIHPRGMRSRTKGKGRPVLSAIDIGGWAEHYATRPYGHYKAEVYGLFVDILACLSPKARVLDVGAGPGHLAREFFKRRGKGGARFVLADASAELLKIARSRLRSRKIKTFVRDFNARGWDSGLGKFDAVVSNNALFGVWPENLERFYGACFARLKRDGIMINQQSFSYESATNPYGDDRFSRFMRALPESILPKIPGMTRKERRRLEEEKRLALKEHRKALAEAKEAGTVLAEERGYQWLTAERHLECMRKAGFACGPIWRKREFAVILGVKGEPLK